MRPPIGKKKSIRPVVFVATLALLVALVLVHDFAPVRAKDRMGSAKSVPVEVMADKKIERRLSAAFGKVAGLEKVSIGVEEGVVVLEGKAPSYEAANTALDLASRLDGVLYVVDRLDVTAEVKSYLAPAWDKLRQVLDQALGFAPLIGIAMVVFLAFYTGGRIATAWEWPYRRLADKILLKGLVRQLIRYAFIFAGLLVALELLGLTSLAGAFMGAAGVIGLALGFAFKDIVENYVAGFLLSLRSPFAYMDWIAVSEHEGSVVRVTSRELIIMTLEGNHVRIPNAQVFKSVIYNYTRNPLRRFDIELGIGVGEDLSRVQEIGVSVLAEMRGVTDDPGPAMRNLEFGDSAMLVRFSGWVDQAASDFLKVRSEAVRILKEALDQAGVEVPVPIQKVIAAEEMLTEAAKGQGAPSQEDLRAEAKRADVDREGYLDEQIEQDRRKSTEVNLLEEP